MKYCIKIIIATLFFILFNSCQKPTRSVLYEMRIYLLQGNKQSQEQLMPPLFPGETSIHFIENVVRDFTQVEQQLKETFGYQFIQLINAKTFTFDKTENSFHLFNLDEKYLLAISIFSSKNTTSLPLRVMLYPFNQELFQSFSKNAKWWENEGKEQKDISELMSIRVDVPITKGIILGRPLPEDGTQALFLFLQPVQSGQVDRKSSTFKPVSTKSLPQKEAPIKNLVSFYELDTKPQVTKRVMPDYPETARKEGFEGMVIIMVLLDETGHVIQATPVRSSGYTALDSAAIQAARKFEFTPAMKDGKPVKVKMTIPFNFRLKNNSKNVQ